MAVKNVAAFNRRWNAIPDEVRKAMRHEMESIAQDLVDEIYGQAPQDTGDMAGTIDWTWGDVPAGSLTIGRVGRNDFGTLRITIFAGDKDTFYARFQEFGTKDMPANPFFFTVYRARSKNIKSRMQRALNRAAKSS